MSAFASALLSPAQHDLPLLQLFFSGAAVVGAATVLVGAAVNVACLSTGASVAEATVAEHEALSVDAVFASLEQHAFLAVGAAVVAADSCAFALKLNATANNKTVNIFFMF